MKVFLFLDFDGTLAPIADTPRRAVLPAATRRALARLARHPRFRVAVISGRALGDLRQKTGVKGVIYAGNHGLEFEGRGFALPVKVPARTRRLLESIHARLTDAFSGVPGVLVENKGLTVSFHYRLVPRRAVPGVRRKFAALLRPFRGGAVAVQPGKMVLEVRPAVDWDKGKTVAYLLGKRRRTDALPVFIGDDATDESAFRELRGRGITVRVGGKRKTAAAFRLPDTTAVRRFLEELENL